MMIELSIARRAAIHAALADRSPSELSASLAIGSNLLAHHLRVLEEAGIVERLSSAGDARRRYVRLVPDAVSVIAEPVATLAARHVLFVCTANSARSAPLPVPASTWRPPPRDRSTRSRPVPICW